jgi:hypothetical protein
MIFAQSPETHHAIRLVGRLSSDHGAGAIGM